MPYNEIDSKCVAPTCGIEITLRTRSVRSYPVNNIARAKLASRPEDDTMLNPKSLDEISSRISELIAASPAKDIEKNARVLLASAFARLDLVTRDEFDLQVAMLARAKEKLGDLEARVAALEAVSQKPAA